MGDPETDGRGRLMAPILALLNRVIAAVGAVISAFLNLMPTSPFADDTFYEAIPEWGKWVSVFIPWETILGIFGLYVSAVAVYYCYRIVLRWIRAVG